MDNFNFKEVELQDKEIFDKYIEKSNLLISECNFTNIFLWKNYYNFKWMLCEHCILLISRKLEGKIVAFPPIGENILEGIHKLKKYASIIGESLEIIRFPKNLVQKIKEEFSSIELIEDRANWDYIHATEDLATFSGNKFQNVRKKLNKFKMRYNWNYYPLSDKYIEQVLKMQEDWCFKHACDDNESLNNENNGIKRILKHFNELNLIGGCICIADSIVAYTIAEEISKDTIVCHIEKANPEFIGSYQAICQLFSETLPKNILYINREQDLGILSLRKSKMHYYPIQFLEKFIIRIN